MSNSVKQWLENVRFNDFGVAKQQTDQKNQQQTMFHSTISTLNQKELSVGCFLMELKIVVIELQQDYCSFISRC
jgi:hypothetical protein